MEHFAHPVEREFAKLLDFYQVPWEYEPRSFILSERPDGSLKSAFTPDFYLPREGIYIELTTISGRQIVRKNRKVRAFRDRYPLCRIQLWNRRQVHLLLAKYGIST